MNIHGGLKRKNFWAVVSHKFYKRLRQNATVLLKPCHNRNCENFKIVGQKLTDLQMFKHDR